MYEPVEESLGRSIFAVTAAGVSAFAGINTIVISSTRAAGGGSLCAIATPQTAALVKAAIEKWYPMFVRAISFPEHLHE